MIKNKNNENIFPMRFETKLFNIGSWTILKIPVEISQKLPSRGQTMIKGTFNGIDFKTALEPDGKGSHWFKVDNKINEVAKTKVGDTVTVIIEPTKEWPEPVIPEDLKEALAADSKANSLWIDITPMARWDWIRWIRGTKVAETRKRRIEVACSKLKAGERRPCCFNRNVCTEPYVSNNGVLLEASQS
jgi:hypothetical protein